MSWCASALKIHNITFTVLRISHYQITVCCRTHYFCPHIKCDICLYNPCQSYFGGTVFIFRRCALSLSLSVCLPHSLSYSYCWNKCNQNVIAGMKKSCLKMHQEPATEGSLILLRLCWAVVLKALLWDPKHSLTLPYLYGVISHLAS